MARRNRRRSRPRHQLHRRVPDSSDSESSIHEYLARSSSRLSGRHRQAQWDNWQACYQPQQLAPIVESRGQAEPSPSSDTAILRQRLHVFGGTVGDGTACCSEMLRVVMTLFDGGIDYMDP
jgi:hypothetical protein